VTPPAFLHRIFERTAARFPAQIAIEIPPSAANPRRARHTYAAIDAAAERLAARLRPLVRGECVVAILLPRVSHHIFVAQLAVLKAGAAYTCIEPDLPAERVRFVLEDSRAVAVLTSSAWKGLAAGAATPAERCIDAVACIDALEAGRDHEGRHTAAARRGRSAASRSEVGSGAPVAGAPPTPAWLQPTSLCYVIYTSGTTGWPKGVMIEHRSIVNLMVADAAFFDLNPRDRIGQLSSCAYDSSVEEIYLAFAVGATLVLMDDDVNRLGPDLVPWLRKERLTMFCPAPTLLRTCPEARPEQDLPDLHTIYVGGEELTPDVANRWAPGRRFVNGYGPTECAVVVTQARVREGLPITIGAPVENNRAWILDAELREVGAGETGELCIEGVNVARGYLHRPDLTQEKFVDHPRYGRIYRTGDLVQRDAAGALLYLGRIDAQVQIRGHRVELGAIESHLSECEGIAAAACKLQEDGRLVAYVVSRNGKPPGVETLRSGLARRLPEYMLPVHYMFVDDLPRMPASGKIDRRALPEIRFEDEGRGRREGSAPRSELEWLVADAMAKHLRFSSHVSVFDDFFHDLGGNSLIAAQVISSLRADERTAGLTVRDLYEARTIAALAAKAAPGSTARQRTAPVTRRRWSGRRVALGSVVQCTCILMGGVGAAAAAFVLLLHLLPALLQRTGLAFLGLALPWLLFAGRALWLPVAFLLAVGTKKLLIGRYTAGRTPYLGSLYVRHWIVQRVVSLVPWGLLEGTTLKNACLRALGARVGRNVTIHTGVELRAGGWDLLEIGDDVTLGRDAMLKLASVHDQEFVLGPITIGSGATVETRACLSAYSSMGEESCLTTLSMLPAGSSIPPGETWDGIPAAGVARTRPAPALTTQERHWSPAAHGALLLLLEFVLGPLVQLPFFAVLLGCALYWQVDGAGVVRWLWAPQAPAPGTLVVLALAVMLGAALVLPLRALACRAMGRTPAGVHSRWGFHFLRLFYKGRSVEAAGKVLNGTLFWPAWLRLAGMRVGRKCEISSIMEVVPELVVLGDESFFADGIYLGAPRLDRGTVSCGETVLGNNTFLGNHVVVPSGSRLPGDILLGVCTRADPKRIRPGTSWFGHPLLELPRREVIAADRRLTHDPAWYRYATRVFWEISRSLLPALPLLLLLAWFKRVVHGYEVQPRTVFTLITLPGTTLVALAIPPALVLGLKWALLGRVREGRHWLWSCWCGRWDLLYVAWADWAHGILSFFEGTVCMTWWLRAMGARIGRRVVLGSGFAQLVDPDMLRCDDDATVACLFQAHSFEDRVLKIAPVHIGAGCSLASGAVLMYGAEIGAGTEVGENSVVMKHEHLLPHHSYVGFPTQLCTPQEPVALPVSMEGAA